MSEQFQQLQKRFPTNGLDLNHTVDSVAEGKFPFAQNVRRHQDGSLAPRVGLTNIATVVTNKTPTHSVRRLSDPVNSDYTYVVGTQDRVAYGKTSFTNLDGAYSGNPLTLVPLRPTQSSHSWMYVADSSRMRKVSQSGEVFQIGLPPPAAPPTVALGTPQKKWINVCDVTTNFVNAGNAGAVATLDHRISTTIAAIWYDTGSTGWCSIQPTAIGSAFNAGMHVVIDTAGTNEAVIVQSVHKAIASTTVSRMIFDAGTSGACSIVFATPVEDITVDSMITMVQAGGSAQTDTVRVQAVIPGPKGTTSIRVTTADVFDTDADGAPSTAITVTGLNTIRTFCNSTHTATKTLITTGLRTALTYAAGAETGSVTYTPAAALDLTSLGTGIPTTDEDDIHLSLRVSDISAITEGRLLLDVDSATNDFTRNYYMLAFRPDELSTALDGTTTVIEASQDKVANTQLGRVLDDDDERSDKDLRIDRIFPTGRAAGDSVPYNPRGGSTARGGTRTDGRGIATGSTVSQVDPSTRRTKTLPIGYRDITGPDSRYRSWVVDNGDSQWLELRFKMRDLVRVGTDETRNLSTVVKVRLYFIVTATVNVDFSSIYVTGGYGPDTGSIGSPYYYRYRARNLDTGVCSNYSPASREEVSPRRQTVTVTVPTYSLATEVEVLDVERYGGSIPQWTYVATIANSATPTLNDIYPDSSIIYNGSDGNTNFQLWPVVGTPVAGSLIKVAGTSIACSAAATVSNATNATPIVITTSAAHGFLDKQWVTVASVGGNTAANGSWAITYINTTSFSLDGSVGTGAYTSGGTVTPNQFSTSWAPGTVIRVDGIAHVIYRVRSATLLELVNNAGSGTVLSWVVDAPVLLGQPLPILFGPYLDFTFGLGDSYNSGTLYFTKRGNPDSTVESYKIEITSPSEPLMNGCVYNGRPYVWSSERMFEIFPSFESLNVFDYREVPNGKGLFSRWALAVGPKMWFLSKDGIYETMGEGPTSITETDMAPLFPRDGVVGETVNGIYAPNIVSAQAANLRLAYADSKLYFDYIDTNSAYRTLVYDGIGWWYEVHTPTPACHYGDEGQGIHTVLVGGRDATTSKLYTQSGLSDAGTAIACQIRTPSLDCGNGRDEKWFGDYFIDANSNNIAVTVTPGYNNHGSTLTADTLTHNGRLSSSFNIASGAGLEARNFSLDLAWSSSDIAQRFYIYGLSYILRPSDTKLRGTVWDDGGYIGAKWLQGVIIDCDTDNAARTVKVYYEGSTSNTAATLTIQNNGRVTLPYSWAGVFCHTMKLVPTDAYSWKVYNYQWVFEPAPELTTTWETPDTSHGLLGFQHIRDIYIAHVSSANITLTVTVDGTDYTYTIAHGTSTYKRTYVPVTAVKGVAFQYKLTSSAGFRLYAQDCEVRVKQWGSRDSYQVIRPFGGDSMIKGAAI